jgi:ATP/maltotriose-dependent transcriptional regulator MalT
LGRALGVSSETIKSHLKSLYAKLDVTGRAEAVTRGFELGLLSIHA